MLVSLTVLPGSPLCVVSPEMNSHCVAPCRPAAVTGCLVAHCLNGPSVIQPNPCQGTLLVDGALPSFHQLRGRLPDRQPVPPKEDRKLYSRTEQARGRAAPGLAGWAGVTRADRISRRFEKREGRTQRRTSSFTPGESVRQEKTRLKK